MNNPIKSLIESLDRLRTLRTLPLVAFAGMLVFAAFAWAQPSKSGSWPTTKWVVMERQGGALTQYGSAGFILDWAAAKFIPPMGERAVIARKHQVTLEAASVWFQSHGFPAPFQRTEDGDLEVDAGEAYLALLKQDVADIGSSHVVDGEMRLTSNPGFLTVDTAGWELMQASAVHELYHGIQKRMMSAGLSTDARELPDCPGDTDFDWLGEGTAAMIQIRWLEGREGVSWGHPFKGSNRAAWIRHFDQPLHEGARPQWGSTIKGASWACDYGTWYFWYAIGDMIGRNDREKVAYTQWLFTGAAPWDDGGIANVDAGLKAAAAAYDTIAAYRGGLYDLYPQFVAQYLTEDEFYGNIEEVTLGAPDLYRTTSSLSGGPLAPLATRAWRFRVNLPEDISSIPYNVRFTLDAADGTDRDALHLIVDERVVHRPVDPTAPYADVQQTSTDGAVEYLVRVANVAAMASNTADAEFSLSVEIDGFYAEDVSSGVSADDIDRIAGALPPGFNMRGPEPWLCGGDKARAIFTVQTPDEAVRELERSLPQAAGNTQNWLKDLEIRAEKESRKGNPSMSREEIAAFRRQVEGLVAAGWSKLQPHVTAAADRARSRTASTLAATFIGQGPDGDCQMTLSATLGSGLGPQIVAGAVDESLYPPDEAPEFAIRVHPAAMLRAMRAGISTVHPADPRRGEWEVCTMTEAEQQRTRGLASGSCPPVVCSAGKLTLEAAEQGRIAGTFEFDVIRWPEDRYAGRCEAPLARDKVVGHFNVGSTDDGNESVSSDIRSGVPGAPVL